MGNSSNLDIVCEKLIKLDSEGKANFIKLA